MARIKAEEERRNQEKAAAAAAAAKAAADAARRAARAVFGGECSSAQCWAATDTTIHRLRLRIIRLRMAERALAAA